METARYENSGFACTFDLDDEETCDRDAPWVDTAHFDGEHMLASWEGDAWCDEHRPAATPPLSLLMAIRHLKALESRVHDLPFPTDDAVLAEALQYQESYDQ